MEPVGSKDLESGTNFIRAMSIFKYLGIMTFGRDSDQETKSKWDKQK